MNFESKKGNEIFNKYLNDKLDSKVFSNLDEKIVNNILYHKMETTLKAVMRGESLYSKGSVQLYHMC